MALTTKQYVCLSLLSRFTNGNPIITEFDVSWANFLTWDKRRVSSTSQVSVCSYTMEHIFVVEPPLVLLCRKLQITAADIRSIVTMTNSLVISIAYYTNQGIMYSNQHLSCKKINFTCNGDFFYLSVIFFYKIDHVQLDYSYPHNACNS